MKIQVYKGGIMKIPQVVIDELRIYRMTVILAIGVILVSGRSSNVSVMKIDSQMEKDSITKIVREEIPKVSKVLKEGVEKTEDLNVKKDLKIPITDIISDKKVLNYICSDERLRRAIEVSDKTGINLAVIIAQKGVECNWGESSLTEKTLNEGNIKCKCSFNSKLREVHKNQDVCIPAYDKREKTYHYYKKMDTRWKGWTLYRELILKRYRKIKTFTSDWDQLMYLQNKGYATIKKNGVKAYASIIHDVIQKSNLKELENYVNKGYIITTSNGKFNLND